MSVRLQTDRTGKGTPAGARRRGVQHLQDYGKRGKFASVLSKSKTACDIAGHQVADHSVAVTNMIDIGSGTPLPAYLGFLAKNKPGGKQHAARNGGGNYPLN